MGEAGHAMLNGDVQGQPDLQRRSLRPDRAGRHCAGRRPALTVVLSATCFALVMPEDSVETPVSRAPLGSVGNRATSFTMHVVIDHLSIPGHA